MYHKNRGAVTNPEGRFEKDKRLNFDDGWELAEEPLPPLKTILSAEYSKSIISHNESPDIGFEQSINPYRGCEHGCIYCYARPSHSYLNLSPGLDFETKLFYKENAAEVLIKELTKPKYVCKTIMVGANTDPYQPIESKLKITRSILKVMLKFKHPVAIITKNSMILRDIDLLTELAAHNLVKVAVSVTMVSKQLKQILEPRTSAPQARIRTIRELSVAGVPVRVMAAPMIPMINDMELEKILRSASNAGARHASYTLIRLPYEVKDLFKEWLQQHYPERANHVMNLIRQMRGGKEYDSTFGKRMQGEGNFAHLLSQRFKLACKRYSLNCEPSYPLDTTKFQRPTKKKMQLDMWDEQYY